MNEPQASGLTNIDKFRKHSIEEKRKRSKLRKKRKQEKAKKAKETTGNSELQPAEKVPEEIRPQALAIPIQVENQEEEKDGEPDEMPECVEKTNQNRDKAHHHAVVFYNNWMKSEKANLPLIQLKDIEITERNIGKGSYGVCDVGFYGTTCVAVKCIQRWNEFKTEEAMVLRKLRHPNIQMFLGVAWQREVAHVVSRFHCIEGRSVTLANAAEKSLLKEENWRKTAFQVCDAVRYLHTDAAMLHNDIKPNNIVVEQGRNALDLIPILIDFGKACAIHEARVMSEERDPTRFPFLAPELNKGQKQSTKSDIFSLGYTLRRISHTLKDFSLRQLYRSCLSDNPLERPEISKIIAEVKKVL